MINLVQQSGGLMVIQMPPIATHTALEMRRIDTLLQHLPVVIKLQHKTIATTVAVDDMGCDATQVGEHTQGLSFVEKAVLAGLSGIVGYCNGLYFETSKKKVLARTKVPGAEAIITTSTAVGTVG